MNDVILRPYTAEDSEAYMAIYEASFPPCERKSFDHMLSSPAADRYELLVISSSAVSVAGMVILAYAQIDGETYALLDYLAVSPDCRGMGIGHAVLPLIRAHCKERRARLFLEIEAPDATADNALQRVLRRAFYISCGLTFCDVTAKMYGTNMELLAFPEDANFVTLHVYRELVKASYPPDMGLPEALPSH